MRFHFRCLLLCLSVATLVLLLSTKGSADESVWRTKIGVSAAIQNSQMDIVLPIWLNADAVLAPSFGMTSIGDKATDTRIIGMLRVNLKKGTAVPYVGFRGGVLTVSPKGGESVSDVIFGPAFGGEYFFNEHFSAGVEAQLNIVKSGKESSRFGNPGRTNMNTATAALVTFYF